MAKRNRKMPEPIDIKKLADFRVTALTKSTSSTSKGLLVLGMIAVCGYSIFVALIQPHTKWAQRAQTQVIKAEKGSVVNVQQKQETPKRRLMPFIEVSVAQSRNSRMDTALRGGVRVEW